MNKNWLSITLLLAIIIGSFVLAGTARFGMAQAEGWRLSKVPIPNGASVEALDMVSSTDGWAVGSDGCILHWDGASWSNVASPTTAKLNSVDMVSSNEGYAIAFNTVSPSDESVIQWDGIKWSIVPTVSGYFRSIDMINSTDGWAVGSGGMIIRWNGTNWNRVESPINNPWESVNMVNASDGWAVGRRSAYSGINSIIHWNGTSWNIVASPDFVGTRTLWSVDMVSSTDGWAVGDGGIIIRWDGSNWEYEASPIPANKHLFSVDMVNSTDGWAVGSDGCIIHWDGASWSNVTSSTTVWLKCVDMVSSTEGWIVGADGIYHWQENASEFPTEYLVIIGALVVVLVVWFFLRKRHAHKQPLNE